MTNYEEIIEELFTRVPAYQNQGDAAIKKDLSNIHKILQALGNPHQSYPTIHIAGTNGKGTCAHLIASILQSSGQKVGLYTSPHYVDFRERIKINGKMIDKNSVIAFIKRIDNLVSDFKPSFFEISVAMSFFYFECQQVDIAIVETGLGGKLDSTNIVSPLVSLITNIGLDHQHLLGDTEYEIAHSKAGIIKNRVPVVIGRFQSSCDAVFLETARNKQAPLTFASLNWTVTNNDASHIFSRKKSNIQYQFHFKNPSPFLMENIISSLETIFQLNQIMDDSIDHIDIQEGIEQFEKNTSYIGRWQTLSKRPLLIADSAHNLDALKKTLFQLESQFQGSIHFIIGFVRGKEVHKVIELLNTRYKYYFTQPSIFRALPIKELELKTQSFNAQKEYYPDVQSAVVAAQQSAQENDLIFITGSSFVVGEALEYFNEL